MHDYQRQGARQTLREGIAEYYRAHPDLKRGSALSPPAEEFFRCHDAVHVIYGCDTSLPHEAIVKVSSIFGTTAGFSVLSGYRLHESIDIYKQLRFRDIVAGGGAAVAVVPRTIVRCARQTKRWPWSDFADRLDTPLCELRAEFGIEAALSPAASAARDQSIA